MHQLLQNQLIFHICRNPPKIAPAVTNITNIKRFYQLYRGALIVSKNSYDLTAEEISELNLLHNKSADETLINKVRDLINRLEYRYVEPEQSEEYIDSIPEQL